MDHSKNRILIQKRGDELVNATRYKISGVGQAVTVRSPFYLLLGAGDLLDSPHVHILLQQRDDVGIERFPVRVLEVVLLRAFIHVALDDGEVLLVVHGLRNEPRQRLVVLGVDVGRFD